MIDGLKALGFLSYDEYLKSPIWDIFKAEYRRSDRPMKCAVCGCLRFELHHHTYERIGRELVDDVTPLCRWHHREVHKFLSKNSLSVKSTALAVQRLRDGSNSIEETPRKKTKLHKHQERKLRQKMAKYSKFDFVGPPKPSTEEEKQAKREERKRNRAVNGKKRKRGLVWPRDRINGESYDKFQKRNTL